MVLVILWGGTTRGCNDEFTGVFSYNPLTNTWTAAANPLFGGNKRAIFALQNVASGIYGGLGRTLTACEQYTDWYRYDADTDTWTTRAAFPGAKRATPVNFSIDGQIYIGMGRRWICNDANFSDIYHYNPTSNTSTARAAFPGPAGEQFGFFAIGDYGYVVTQTNLVYRYDPAMDSRSLLACQYPGSTGISTRSVVVGGSAYLVSTTGAKSVWRFTP